MPSKKIPLKSLLTPVFLLSQQGNRSGETVGSAHPTGPPCVLCVPCVPCESQSFSILRCSKPVGLKLLDRALKRLLSCRTRATSCPCHPRTTGGGLIVNLRWPCSIQGRSPLWEMAHISDPFLYDFFSFQSGWPSPLRALRALREKTYSKIYGLTLNRLMFKSLLSKRHRQQVAGATHHRGLFKHVLDQFNPVGLI